MNFTGLKEIKLYFKLLESVNDNPKNLLSRTDVGNYIDESYPNSQTHSFLKKIVMLKILEEQHKISYKGKIVPIYKINKKRLLEVVSEIEEYNMLEYFYSEKSLIQVLKPGIK